MSYHLVANSLPFGYLLAHYDKKSYLCGNNVNDIVLYSLDMMKRFFLYLCLGLSLTAQAQIYEPVEWSIETTTMTDSTATIALTATIEAGWHLYATELPADGPRPTTFTLTGAESITPIVADRAATSSYDENFMMELSYYENKVTFSQEVLLRGNASVEVNYMVCNDENCLPAKWDATIIAPAAKEQSAEKALSTNHYQQSTDQSLLWLFFMGFLGGLLAIFTPCVWPIIPMTVSFFLKRNENGGLRDAILYGLAIILIYVGLGLLITLIFGASALNSLATNAVVNLIFFAILVIFAISFFGAFEITLPSSWSTALDSKASKTTGFLSILMMAFTLVIVSFSCTGPIIGTLLVEAAGKSVLAPAIGMLGFAVALALPFTLFALFPKVLKKLPRSGSWMNTFKVTLAFLELALAMKFFSVADLAYGWHLMDREVFLSLWIVIFALLGVYLLGGIRFPHDSKQDNISVTRFMLALVSLSFAVYMVPGLWGAPLKAISAFAPPMSTQDFVITAGETEQHTFDSLEEAYAKAKAENKQILLDFSGYGCVNCRKMEAKVLSDERVQARLKDFIVVTLIVDDRTALAEPIIVEENGKTIALKTVGDKWSHLQRSRFKANAQPYYIQLNSNGETISTSYAYDEDVEKFLDWLN